MPDFYLSENFVFLTIYVWIAWVTDEKKCLYKNFLCVCIANAVLCALPRVLWSSTLTKYFADKLKADVRCVGFHTKRRSIVPKGRGSQPQIRSKA